MEEPSTAEKESAVADAGLGATSTNHATFADAPLEKPANGAPTNGPANGTSTEGSTNDAVPEVKPVQTEAPKQRSTAKIALIMLSLCV